MKYHLEKANMVVDTLSKKSQMNDATCSMNTNLFHEGMRKLLLENSQQEKLIDLMQEVKPMNYDELK